MHIHNDGTDSPIPYFPHTIGIEEQKELLMEENSFDISINSYWCHKLDTFFISYNSCYYNILYILIQHITCK